MPFSYSSYGDIGGSPFQQYENQQQQFQLQQQQARNQQNQQQNPAFGGQTPQLGGGFQQYGQQQYGGMQQYNPLPTYNFNQPQQNQGFQATPINQSDYTNFQTAWNGPMGQTFVQNPQISQAGLTTAEQNYFKQQTPQQQPQQTNPYISGYSAYGYNSLPTYNFNPFQYSSPSGGTGQYFTGY